VSLETEQALWVLESIALSAPSCHSELVANGALESIAIIMTRGITIPEIQASFKNLSVTFFRSVFLSLLFSAWLSLIFSFAIYLCQIYYFTCYCCIYLLLHLLVFPSFITFSGIGFLSSIFSNRLCASIIFIAMFSLRYSIVEMSRVYVKRKIQCYSD
jgi:hypothetical protein